MIIVGQGGYGIYNFDNIVSIELCANEIIYSTLGEQDYCTGTLGVYKTEERANEVLKEIIKFYSGENKFDKRKHYKQIVVLNKDDIDIFYMPES